MRWLIFAYLLLFQSIELSLLIYSGKYIGFFTDYLDLLITGIGGAYLAKWQGMKAWNDLKSRYDNYGNAGKCID